MDLSLTAAYSALSAAQKALEWRAQDLANARTPAYRPQGAYFESLVSAEWNGGQGVQELPWGVRAVAGGLSGQSGPLNASQDPLHLALQDPDDYFAVQTPAGVRYTRQGAFHLDPEGRVLGPQGHPLLGLLGELRGQNGARFSPDGGFDPGQGPGDRVRIVNLKGMDLQREGGQLFRLPEGGSAGEAKGGVLVGQLEGSATDVFKGMADLVVLMRWAESAQKAARVNDEAAAEVLRAAKL